MSSPSLMVKLKIVQCRSHALLEMSPFVAIDFTGMKEYAITTSKNHKEKEIFFLYFMPYRL